jgi:predicted secreted protein
MFNLPIAEIISFSGTLLLLALIVTIHRRGEQKTFPRFFLYLIVVLFKSEIVLLIQPFSAVAHFYAYWVGEGVTILLSFTVIYEICSHIISSTAFPLSKTTFFRINVGLLLFASIVAALTIHSAPTDPVVRTVIVLTTALRTMQIGLFALLTAVSLFYGFFWTNSAFGIALGYGLYALSQLANTLVRVSVGVLGHEVYRYIAMLGYDCTVLIWLAYALRAGQQEIKLEKVPDNDAAQWMGALERVAK